MRALPICLLLVMLCNSRYVVAVAKANTATTPAWTLNYYLSANSIQPGGQISLSIEITVQKQVYDFDLQVEPGTPLTVSGGHIHINSLSPGDVRDENFTINAPSSVQEGEVYVVNLLALSFSDPAPFWGRLGQSPDIVFDTTLKPENAMQVKVVAQPLLMISSFMLSTSNPTVGDTVTATAVINNQGTAPVVNVNATIQVPPSVTITNGQASQLLGDIPRGQSATVSWTFVPQTAGSYSIFLQVSSSNQKTATSAQALTVNPSLWQQITTSASLITIAFVVVVLLLISIIFKKMQG